MNIIIRLFTLLLVTSSLLLNVAPERNYIVTISDQKDYKKLLRVHKNVMILFSNSSMDKRNELKKVIKTTMEAAKQAIGQGTVAQINCNDGEMRKLCKKLKVMPKPYILKHYQSGEFHKNYDRRLTTKSMYRFLLDPTSGIPWDEDPTVVNVIHLDDSNALRKLVGGGKSLFYVPWCGFCKRLKPEFSAAADQLKGKVVLAGMDLTHRGNKIIAKQFNIDGYPTLEYFENGKHKFRYRGQNSKNSIIEWLKNSQQQATSPSFEEEISWTDTTTEVVVLTDNIFDEFVVEHRSVLVLLYAPLMKFFCRYNLCESVSPKSCIFGCGHCKLIKLEFIRATKRLKTDGIDGVLAAIDATKNKYGFPTIIYLSYGKNRIDYTGEHETASFITFVESGGQFLRPRNSIPELDFGNVVTVLDENNFDGTVNSGNFSSGCGHCEAVKPAFCEAAEQSQYGKFAVVDCTVWNDLCERHNVKGYPTFQIFVNGIRYDYSGNQNSFDFTTAFMKAVASIKIDL